MTSTVVFVTDPDCSFVAGLARFLHPPAEPAAPAASAEGEEAAVPPAQPSEFERECVALEAKRDFAQLSEKLSAALKAQFGTASESDVENGYAILLQLLVQWEMLQGKVLALADELSASAEERPLLRRSLLLSLYNLALQNNLVEARFPLLLKVIKYCDAAGQLEQVLGGASKRCASVERWIREWELGAEQQKELWGVIFDAHIGDARATYEHALKYLPLHSAADVGAQPALRERMVRGLLVILRSKDPVRAAAAAPAPAPTPARPPRSLAPHPERRPPR